MTTAKDQRCQPEILSSNPFICQVYDLYTEAEDDTSLSYQEYKDDLAERFGFTPKQMADLTNYDCLQIKADAFGVWLFEYPGDTPEGDKRLAMMKRKVGV